MPFDFIRELDSKVKAIIASIVVIGSLVGLIIAVEDRYQTQEEVILLMKSDQRYVTKKELDDHAKLYHNKMVHKELEYAVARSARLREALKYIDQSDTKYRILKMEYDASVIKRDSIKMELIK